MMVRIVLVGLLFFFLIPAGSVSAQLLYPQPDVLIDAGHGGIDSGTSAGHVYEKDLNLKMGLVLYEKLADRGYHVVLNRTGDYALSDENQWLRSSSRHRRDLAQRKGLIDTLSPRVVVSLHVNWAGNSRKRGPLVLYQKNTRSFLLAEQIQQSLNQLYKTSFLPIPGKTYYILNRTEVPTVIVEMGYISNPSDREWLSVDSQREKLAEAIMLGIEDYFTLVNRWRP
ncbi:MAG: N-acetylmuramoyl-L-alanine amidase [Bacillaceae bacterium]|nr:N-acetylmuramoyl-L-alanine amidase [Bacillaceae bacterium]